MNRAPRTPTAELVQAACETFDRDYLIVEQALKELFGQYPGNNDHPHVLLKVVALNRLYSTQIFAVHDVARHIHQQAEYFDSALTIGSPEIVDKIAKVTIRTTGKERTIYSFATKYCSWHDQASYPMWDSRVSRYLRFLKQTPFAKVHNTNWNSYREFVGIMTAVRTFYALGSFTFKEIDKFLWLEGAPPVKPTG